MRTLVTGGAGFIGSNLAHQLIKDGHAVTILDNFQPGRRINPKSIKAAMFIEGDVRDKVAVEAAPKGADVIFYLAASVRNRRSIDMPTDGAQTNILATINIMEAARTRQVPAPEELHRRFGLPVIISFHPRTRTKVEEFVVDITSSGLHFLAPMGFFDFTKLEKNAFSTLSCSGTVQHVACIFGVVNVTIRDATERPETVGCGSNILAGDDPVNIVNAVHLMTSRKRNWFPPPECLAPLVAETGCNLLLSQRLPDAAEIAWRSRGLSPAS